jgi:hypothetical protein
MLVLQLSGTLNFSGTAVNAKNAGNYIISASGYSSSNYAINYQDASLIITQANLTIAADVKNKNYGDVDPALTLQYQDWLALIS